MAETKQNQQVFTVMSVPRAVGFMVLPAIVSQIIHVIYNLADTWFVGMTGDPNAVAAISLCLPVYNILTGLSNLFGVGGASVIARAVGYGDRKKARQAFAVSAWAALAVSAAYSLLLLIVQRPLLLRIGGDAGDIDFAVNYCFVTVVVGGVPTVLAAAFSNLIRATGESRRAAGGMTLGAVCNIALDPLFMFVLLPKGNEVLGAALATALANMISLIYFALFFLRQKNELYGFHPRLLRRGRLTLGDVTRNGMAGFTMVSMAMVSNCFLNAMISGYGGGAAMAGLGIVRKIDSLAYAVNQGITQGMLPLVAYSYGAGNRQRMRGIIAFSAACTVIFSLCCTTVSYLLAPNLVQIFIRDADTVRFGAAFLRILCLAIPIYSVTFVIIAVFQAVGRSMSAFVLSLLHKGSVDILLLFVIRALFGPGYVLWAAPIMESAALCAGIIMLRHFQHLREHPGIQEVVR